MLVGQEKIKSTFEKLISHDELSHGYIFYGEPQVGKFTFALGLASFLEKGKFEIGGDVLQEVLIVDEEEGSIGIDAIREVKRFLSLAPINSTHRVVIIDNADLLTEEAQNAILKISEEPPQKGLLILTTSNIDLLADTLKSRFQKVYFQKLKSKDIESLLIKSHGISEKDAESIANLSFGRPGRAVLLATDEAAKERMRIAKNLINKKINKAAFIADLIENNHKIYPMLSEITAILAVDPIRNYDILRSISERTRVISQYSTNKRLQLETAIWTI